MSKVKSLWPIALIILLVVIFFWKFFLKGLLPIPADIIVGMYFPWLDYKWGYVVGVPVKNPLLSDTVSQFWVWRNLAIDLIKQGKSPFWNPFSLAGSPLVPIFHSSLFSPFNLFWLFLPRPWAMGLVVILQPFLAACFMYLFLKSLNLSSLSSIFGSITFAFSGFMLAWLSWGTVGHTILWLPFVLWATKKYGEEKKMRYLFFLLLGLIISLTAGHLQTFFYLFTIWLLWFFYLLKGKGPRFLLVPLIVICLFLLLSSFLTLPALETMFLSIRSRENYIAEFNYGFFPPLHLITFLAPDFFGNPATANWWGRSFYYQELIGYFGLVALVFAFSAFWKKDNHLRFWKISFLLSLLLAFKYPLGWLVYKLRIPLLSTASASRILILNSFSGAVLASFGFEKFLRRRKRKTNLQFILPFWVLLITFVLVAGIGWILAYLHMNEFVSGSEAEQIILSFLSQMKIGLRNLILPVLILAWITILFFISKWIKSKKFNLLIGSLFCLLLSFELLRFGWKYTPFVTKDFWFPSTPIQEFLQQKADVFRIEREKGPLLPPNMWIPARLYSASGYDPVYPASFGEYLSYLQEGELAPFLTRYADVDNYRSRLFDLLGIKYILALKRDKSGRFTQEGMIDRKFKLPNLKNVFEDKTVVVLENENVLPRAILFHQVEVRKNKEDLERLLDQNFDFKKKLILEEEIVGELGVPEIKETVEISKYCPQEVEIRLEAQKNGMLFLSDNYYPGWKAFVDNEETKIYRANFTFRAVFVPKGKHTVRFIYAPLSFKIGTGISLTTLIVLGGLFAYETKNRCRASL